MGDLSRTVPTIVFESETLRSNGLVHLVSHSDAVPSRNAVLVTTRCGLIGAGKVKLRRGANCGECLDAAKNDPV